MRQWLLAAVFTAAVLARVHGQDMTGQKIEQAVADTIAPKLKELGHKAVTLAPVTWADTGKPAAAGAGVSQALADSLTKHGIGLTAGGTLVLGGTLARVTDDKSDPPAPADKLTLTLTADAKVVCEAEVLMLMEGTLRVDPVDVVLPPQATPLERVTILTAARDDKPDAVPPGQTVKWGKDKTVGLELRLAKAADVQKARQEKATEEAVSKLFAARELDPRGRVKTADGESCRVRLVNKNVFDIAGELRVAGVDWSAFAADADTGGEVKKAKSTKEVLRVVVPANGEVVIRGWYRTDTTSLTFDVRQLPASAAGRQADTGVISFEYAACWVKGEKPAVGEEEVNARLAGLGIMPGGVQADKFERAERVIGKTRGAVKVEYGELKD